jgi:hypothetical protein
MTHDEVVALLAQHEQAHDGLMEPDVLASEAENPSHPLHEHPYWEWDVEKAYRKYNVQAAQRIIRSVKYQHTTPQQRVINAPVYVRDPVRRKSNYVPMMVIRDDADASREALLAAFKRVVDALRFAQTLAKVFDLDNDIEQMKDQVVSLMGRITTIDDQPQGNA